MKRLTERDEFRNADIVNVDSYEWQMNLDSGDFNRVTEALNKLADYEDLEEQGKLLKLPCAVGDTLYRFYSLDGKRKVYEHHIKTLTNLVNIVESGEIGITAFLTWEEAEAALKELTN